MRLVVLLWNEFCEARQEAGLQGLAIQWGAIGDVGLTMDTIGGNEKFVSGTFPQRMNSCLKIFYVYLQHPQPVLASTVLAEKKSDSGLIGLNTENITVSNTLADFCMVSLMGAEIKQTLERNYNLLLSVSEIRIMTVKRLHELQSNSGGVPSGVPADTTTNGVISRNDQVVKKMKLIFPVYE
ncbi:Hypothetical protein CINCED_3A018173 [Cinara cedri]|uniref:Uncharacterized protein n=1 Tax=Cinara cedri TaxID=506608 RepID=A0A5E4MHQ1_9HEMI|nr:Hypothetical protein CINCED_3A018173 [Cinara cedri]